MTAASCETALGAVSDTSFISPASPEIIVSSTDDICSQGVGSVTATPGPGSPEPCTYSWPALGASTKLLIMYTLEPIPYLWSMAMDAHQMQLLLLEIAQQHLPLTLHRSDAQVERMEQPRQ